jgi:HEPN domain-containing protein
MPRAAKKTPVTKKFRWPAYPKTEEEFEALMKALDAKLEQEGLLPWQRPMHIGSKLWEALKWEGLLFPPKELAEHDGFEGDVLKAKALRWYEEVYGQQLNSDFAYGHVPVRLGKAMFRVRAGLFWGQVGFFADPDLANRGNPVARPAAAGQAPQKATLNVLTQAEGLTTGLTSRLSREELREFSGLFQFMMENLKWRDTLPKNELFSAARGDYDECTENVLANRPGHARWSAQQAVEKTIKGFLQLGGTTWETGNKGHDLKLLGGLLETNHGISIQPGLLALASCSTEIRYGKASTPDDALRANHAVLGVLEQLRKSSKAVALLAVAA